MADPVTTIDLWTLLSGGGGLGVSGIAAYLAAKRFGLIRNGQVLEEKVDRLISIEESEQERSERIIVLLEQMNTFLGQMNLHLAVMDDRSRR